MQTKDILLIKKFLKKRKIGIIGLGSIGKRHFHNLSSLSSKIYIYDKKFSKKTDLQFIYNKCEEVFICSPLNTHEKYLKKLMDLNKNIFIEKPFILNVKKLRNKIINYNKKKIIYVGFNLRFREIIQYIKKLILKKKLGRIYWARFLMSSHLPNWRKNYDYKSSYTNSKKYGGVLLDSIHELDLAEFFFGSSNLKNGFVKNLNILKINSDEFAHLNLIHKNKVISNIQLDYINKFHKRLISISGSKGYLNADISNGKLNIEGIRNIKKKFKSNRNLEYKKEILDFYIKILKKKQNQNISSNLNVHLIAKEIKESLKR